MINELFEPLKQYDELSKKHFLNVSKCFENLVNESSIDIEKNKKTCEKYYKIHEQIQDLYKEKKKQASLSILYLVLCLVLIGIFLLINLNSKKIETNSLIKKLEDSEKEILADAYKEMLTLNSLFNDLIPVNIVQKTLPFIQFDRILDAKKYEYLKTEYGFWDNTKENESVLDMYTGTIFGNSFVYFKVLEMTLIDEEYTGSLDISYWVDDDDEEGGGHMEYETLYASIYKPVPHYDEHVFLVYFNEAAHKLEFSRCPTCITFKNEKDRVKTLLNAGDKLQEMSLDAVSKGKTFTPLGNTEFEISFAAFNRNDEQQFRLLFTPLAQKSFIELFNSSLSYGDDFTFIKDKFINIVASEHAQLSNIFINKGMFKHFDFEIAKNNFTEYNMQCFKSLYFDVAPLLSIPLYQQYQSKGSIDKKANSNFICFDYEIIANRYNRSVFMPQSGKTDQILKGFFERKNNNQDVVKIISHSFDMIDKVEFVPVCGGDGDWYDVPVEWIDYVPVQSESEISVGDLGTDDEVKFRSLGQNNVIYAKGLVSTNTPSLNVDINQLKSIMSKD